MKFNKIFFIILIFGSFLFFNFAFASLPTSQLNHSVGTRDQAHSAGMDGQAIGTGLSGDFQVLNLWLQGVVNDGTRGITVQVCQADSMDDFDNNSIFVCPTAIASKSFLASAFSQESGGDLFAVDFGTSTTFLPEKYYGIKLAEYGTGGDLVYPFGADNDNAYVNTAGTGNYRDQFGTFGYLPTYPQFFNTNTDPLKDLYFSFGLAITHTLAINFPQNEATTSDFSAFRLAWNISDYENYSDYWGRVNLFFGTDQEKIALCGDELASYYCKDDWPNVDLEWNSWNTITEIKDPIWIRKDSRPISEIGTYYAKAVFYAISNDVPYEEILLAESPEISFNIIKGNYVNNYWDWVMASTSIPTFVEQASSTFFLDISDINSPFYKDCSVYENCDFFSTCTLFAIACDIEKISLKLVWTMVVKYPKIIAESFSDFFNYMVMRFVNTFPLSILTTFNKAIQDIEASSTPPLILSGSGKIFGGKSFTILSSSTLDWINNTETGFSLRNFFNNICYGITGLITIGFSVLAIMKLKKPSESEEV